MYWLISLLSGCALKAAFVSEGYFHKDVQSPASTPPLRFFFSLLISLLFSAHACALKRSGCFT